MLDPDQRSLFIDALRPPPGMSLERAVGTTFTLDLEALLLVPVALTTFEVDEGRVESLDPIVLLEVVRRYADRIDLFCQAGHISVPRSYQPILTHLEDSIHPVTAVSRGHVFHPKTWVLLYRAPQGDSSHVRVLVASRNLTFDRSWDLLLRLDEAKTGDPLPGAARFVSQLPDRAIHSVAPDRRGALAALAERVDAARFAPPAPFDRIEAFHVFGLGDDPPAVFEPADRRLTVSPFLTTDVLHRLAASAPATSVVSRQATLDALNDDTLSRFDDVWVFDEAANPEPPDGSDDEVEDARPNSLLTGLHAKAFIAERRGTTRALIGSANATDAAFGGNVEVLVSLVGRTDRVGIDAVLGDDDRSLQSLLQRHVRSTDPGEQLEHEEAWIDVQRAALSAAAIPLTATVGPADDDAYTLRLTSRKHLTVPPGVTVRWWPLSLAASNALAGTSGEALDLDFGRVSLAAITSFFGIHVAIEGRADVSVTSVVNATLKGAPEDRRERVLAAHLQDRRDVLRYLLLLLTEFSDGERVSQVMQAIGGDAGSYGDGRAAGIPLFEAMIRALVKSPASLDRVHRLIADLRATDEGAAKLPEGLDRVWEPIWAARQQVG